MVENIKIKCIKRVLTEEQKFLNVNLKEADTLKFYKQAESDVNNFIESGTKIFTRKAIIFGEEKLIEFTIEESLGDYSTWEISKAIVSFNANPSGEAFTKLVNTYFLDFLTFVATSEDFETSSDLYLESDIGSLYIFIMTYFPELMEKSEPIFLKGLEHLQKERDNNIRPMKGSYGRESILYLAYWLAKEHNRSENVINQLLNYCAQKIELCYIKAVENAFSKNESDIQTVINELAEFHIKNSKTVDLTYPFHRNQWIYFPVEILGVLKIRSIKGLNYNSISHPLINIFTPFLNMKLKLESDVLLLKNKFL